MIVTLHYVCVSSEMMSELGLEDVSFDESNADSAGRLQAAAAAAAALKPPDSARVSSLAAFNHVLSGS